MTAKADAKAAEQDIVISQIEALLAAQEEDGELGGPGARGSGSRSIYSCAASLFCTEMDVRRWRRQ